ncbi:MAG: SurA N-terminal domain-containing protein, partial [Gemmatimonadales bacterium]
MFASLFIAAPSLDAQDEQYQLIDGVVAVVGSTPIPRSRIDEQLQMLRRQNPNLATDSAAIDQLSRLILDTLIIEELLVQAAERDTLIFVIEEEVQSRADEQMRTIR